MESKKLIYFGMIVGSVVGGYLPIVWGGSAFSFSSVILSAIGGIAGIFIAFKLTR